MSFPNLPERDSDPLSNEQQNEQIKVIPINSVPPMFAAADATKPTQESEPIAENKAFNALEKKLITDAFNSQISKLSHQIEILNRNLMTLKKHPEIEACKEDISKLSIQINAINEYCEQLKKIEEPLYFDFESIIHRMMSPIKLARLLFDQTIDLARILFDQTIDIEILTSQCLQHRILELCFLCDRIKKGFEKLNKLSRFTLSHDPIDIKTQCEINIQQDGTQLPTLYEVGCTMQHSGSEHIAFIATNLECSGPKTVRIGVRVSDDLIVTLFKLSTEIDNILITNVDNGGSKPNDKISLPSDKIRMNCTVFPYNNGDDDGWRPDKGVHSDFRFPLVFTRNCKIGDRWQDSITPTKSHKLSLDQ